MNSAAHSTNDPASRSVAAIVSLVLGIVALATSFIPFVNNISAILAIVGAVFGIVGVVATLRGTRVGKAMAIVALVLNIVACMAVYVAQDSLSKALDEAFEGATVTSTSTAAVQTGDADQGSSATQNTAETSSELVAGSTATLSNGLSVTVNSVQTGLVDYSGDLVTGVNVTYANNGTSEVSFNALDWKGQDENGVISYETIYIYGENTLSSGSLAAGGSVSGNVYFDGTLTKVMYYSSLLSSSPAATWTVSEA